MLGAMDSRDGLALAGAGERAAGLTPYFSLGAGGGSLTSFRVDLQRTASWEHVQLAMRAFHVELARLQEGDRG